jgi:hypothetical protein
MFDWLLDSPPGKTDVPAGVIASHLGLAFVLGCVVAAIHRWTHAGDRPAAPNITTTLVLLAILIAMVTEVIGNSVARAFSLVGALAIVRFRTVVEDTRDTAFVIFAVVVGMAVGAGFRTVALVGIPIVGAAALLLRPGGLAALGRSVGRAPAPLAGFPCTLAIRIGCGHDPGGVVKTVFDRYLAAWQLVATATARQGAALDLTYTVRLRDEDAATALVLELNRTEGIQNVELRRL